jgi:Xaa-Pro aminopeptidase
MPRVPYDWASRAPHYVSRFSDAEFERRVSAVRATMDAAGLDALIVCANRANTGAVRYLTNFVSAFGSAFAVLHADGRLALATDSVLHGEPMHSMFWLSRVSDMRVALGPIYGGAFDEVARLAADAARPARRVGLAGGAALSHALYAALAGALPGLVAADGVLDGVRGRKSDEEIAAMREAARISDAAMAAALAAVRAGAEECAVAAEGVAAIHRGNGTEAFHTCVVSGPRAGFKHGMPTRRRMEDGDLVFLDLGAGVEGYLNDASRCTVVGRAEGRARDLLESGLALYHAGLEAVGPGRTIDDVSNAILAAARRTAFETYYCATGFGHGIGTALLEAPGLYAGNRFELRPRMTFAYEPMIVVEGLGTAVVEDTLLITETGCERLNEHPVVTWS